MRVVLFLFLFLSLGLNAQDANHTAQTAGGEFPDANQQSNSITSGTMVNCVFEEVSRPKDEFIAQLPQSVEIVSSKKTNPIIYLVVILLIGLAIHTFLSKKENSFTSQVDIQEEEDDQRKKELWEAMAQPETEE